MPQIFHPSTNVISRLSIVGVAVLLPLLIGAAYGINTRYFTYVGLPREQPVQFSHKHHVSDDGIDCRFCHSTVDRGASAGMPSTHTCMTCHSQMWSDSPMLQPVLESFRTGRPIEWNRVHDLPDFAYFDHSIHVNKGVACVSCHGRVDEMPLVRKEQHMSMAWCLDCHRNPEAALRPLDFVYDPEYVREKPEEGRNLMRQYQILSSFQLTNCSTCHR
jgi:hypothetical protein